MTQGTVTPATSGIVLFTAEWCSPCKILKKRLTDSLPDLAPSVIVVDIENQPEETQRAKVTTVPTLVIYQNGKATASLTGLQSPENIRKFVAAH